MSLLVRDGAWWTNVCIGRQEGSDVQTATVRIQQFQLDDILQLPLHTKRRLWGGGGICPARPWHATFVLTIPALTPDLPSPEEPPKSTQVDRKPSLESTLYKSK